MGFGYQHCFSQVILMIREGQRLIPGGRDRNERVIGDCGRTTDREREERRALSGELWRCKRPKRAVKKGEYGVSDHDQTSHLSVANNMYSYWAIQSDISSQLPFFVKKKIYNASAICYNRIWP